MLTLHFSGEHANDQIGTPTKVSGDEISKVIATFGTVRSLTFYSNKCNSVRQT